MAYRGFMNILHITREQDSDFRYGIRKSLLPIIKVLKDRGHHVEIFDWKKSSNFPSSKIEVYLETLYLKYINKRFSDKNSLVHSLISERISIVRKAAKYVARNDITHVHCHDPLLGYYYNIFSKIYKSTKCWGYTIHSFGRFVKKYVGIEINERNLIFLQNLEKKAEKQAKWVIVPTKSGLNQMAQELKIKYIPKTWHVIPHIVSITLINREEARKNLGIKDNVKLLLAVGRLDKMKRFSLLLEAFYLIPSDESTAIILLGEGPEKVKLLNLAKQLNIIDKFEIRVTDNIGIYLSAANIYVSTSSTESFGLANCEAVMAGVPSICTNVGAVAELLEDAVILVDDNKYKIAKEIENLLYSNELKLKLQKNSKIVSAKWPDAEAIAKKTENIFLACKD